MPYLHPLVTAKALATLDQMSGGRVIAGLGVGGLPEENEILGVMYDGRGPLGDEFIEAMQAVWAPGEGEYSGEHYAFQGAIASPKPAQDQLPIWIGGSGGPARRRTATYGRGWHPLCTLEGLERRMPAMMYSLEAVGRDRDDLVVAPRVDVAAVPDAAAVQAWAEAGADELIVMANSADVADHRGAVAHVATLAQQMG